MYHQIRSRGQLRIPRNDFCARLSFLEFVPVDEYHRWTADTTYQPNTALLDEVEPGQSYVLVITNFHGGAFIRYVIGDMIKITSLRNENLNIDIPQMVFDRRVDNLMISLASPV